MILALLVPGCSSCRKKSEPTRDPAFDPASDAAARATTAGASSSRPRGVAAEERDRRTRLDPELCGEGAKRVNTLHKRTPTDPIAVDLLSTCLKYGSVAWYKCVLAADTAAAVDACGPRFLQPPDEK